MRTDALILELVERMIESGSSAEDVCANCPELLPDVVDLWRQCQQVEAHLDAIFASAAATSTKNAQAESDAHSLPAIPGYTVLSMEGKGGMGIVYRARHLELNRLVALKMMLSGAYADRIERGRFLREARAVASLRHANIVHVYEVGEFEGKAFFTMELLGGKTLAATLNGTPQAANKAAAFLAVIAHAVECAHANGILHRDLKPSNIVLTETGVPKITDFGLARPLTNDTDLTLTGLRLGTPSYMSPEQAMGKETLGPTSDVYSLGAILYELLTGRPPFQGESAADTERLLHTEDPIPPSKLNPKVPRDLETICLTCLQKDRNRRYSTALALAEDIERFQRHEPILAREIGTYERTSKWIKRHPATTTALVACSMMAVSVFGAAGWYLAQRSASQRIAAEHLRDAVAFQQRSAWGDADTAIERAAAHVDDAGSASLERAVELARNDSDLVKAIDAIRLEQSQGLSTSDAIADRKLRETFLKWRIGELTEQPQVIASRIQLSNVRTALTAALYDWMHSTDSDSRHRLWEIIQLADPDPTGWRDHLRSSNVWEDGNRLLKAANETPDTTLASQPVPFLMACCRQLERQKKAQIGFVKRVQSLHPQDFWANLYLGDVIRIEASTDHAAATESLQYYRAAIAIRPDAAVAYNNLGIVLGYVNRNDEAISAFRTALNLDPNAPIFQFNLAYMLSKIGNYKESIPIWRIRVTDRPKNPSYRTLLSQDLLKDGKVDEAIDEGRTAVKLNPQYNPGQAALRCALLAKGLDQDVLDAWQHSVSDAPTDHAAWDGYAEYCLRLDRTSDYDAIRTQLLRQFGDSTDPLICERVGKTCLLRPGSQEEILQAAALIDRALHSQKTTPAWTGPYFQFSKALAEYRSDQFASAMTIISSKVGSVMGPAPRMVTAMCQWKLGRQEDARGSLTAAMSSYDWTPTRADAHERWMYDALRKEAEAMILPAGKGSAPAH